MTPEPALVSNSPEVAFELLRFRHHRVLHRRTGLATSERPFRVADVKSQNPGGLIPLTVMSDPLSHVWKSPEDPARLQVYADWLLEHGDATRGEFMQLSLLASPTPAQAKRRETLRKKHRGAWLGTARRFIHTWRESESCPGFLESVTCSPKNLAAGFSAIVALGPRLLVSLLPAKTAADRALLASLPLGDLYGLSLAETDLGWVSDRLLEALAPKLDGLRHLELLGPSSALSLSTCREVLESLESLDELELKTMPFDFDGPDPWLEMLLQSSLTKRLRFVRLSEPRNPGLRRRLVKAFKGRWLSFD
jgi:uncharacterized protein (TIGR02996 family)